MQHATTRSIFTYWNDVRGTRSAPRRLEIEPSRIAPFLSETMILERSADDRLSFRLAGTRICEIFGRELRGSSFIEMWPEADREEIAKALASSLRGAAIELRFEGTTERGLSCCFEAIVLPLLHTGETVDRYLGAIVPMQQPYWLGGEAITTVALQACDVIWPARNAAWEQRPQTDVVPVFNELAGARQVISLGRRFRVLDGGLAHIPKPSRAT
jgi:hypothetical protein